MALALPSQPSDLLSALMPPEEPLALGYDSKKREGDEDYTPAPRLDKEQAIQTAQDLMADHSVRVAQSRKISSFYECIDSGHFEEDEDLIEAGIMETMPLLGAREDFEFRKGWLASHTPYPSLSNRDLIDADEALMVEDTVLYHMACADRQYARKHRSDRSLAKAHHLLACGGLVGLNILDPYDDKSGLEMDLLDPLTCFPVLGGPHGILEMYRIYEDTNESIIGQFGGPPGTREYRRIEEKVKKGASKTKRGRTNVMHRGELRDVTQVWTYDEMLVLLDDEQELVRVKHDYRRVPIILRVGAFDLPVGMSIGNEMEYSEPREYATDWGHVTVSDTSMDIARQWKPFNYRVMRAHIIAEAVAGRDLSTLKAAWDPHFVTQFDPTMDWQSGQKPNVLPGEETRIPLPGSVSVVLPTTDPITKQSVAANLQANASGGGFLTQMRLGAVPPQTSGSAMNKLQMLGGAGDITLVKAMEGFDRDEAEWRLEMIRVFGDAVGKPQGVTRVPNKRYGGFHIVTPDALDRSGTEIDIELFMPIEDAGAAQWATTMRAPSPSSGKPLASDETLRRRLKLVPDVEREVQRIEREALNALPPVAQQRQMAQLEADLEFAEANGDDKSAAEAMIQILELKFLHDKSIAEGTAAPPGGEGGAGFGQQTQQSIAPPSNTPALPGTSLPDQGIAVGNEGARPVGTQNPTPITPITPPPGQGQGF